jgi:hypothetical protein
MGRRGTLADEFPVLAAQFDLEKNHGLSPADFSSGSDKKVWWLGPCGHSWEASVGHRTRGRGCPICSGNKVAVGVNDLATTHPDLAREFDPIKNGKLSPTELSAGSNKMIWWMGECSHSWQAPIARRAKGSGCPVCDGKVIIAGSNDLETTHPEVARYFSEKNLPLTSKAVHAGTPRKAWFRCDFEHEYEMAVNSKTRLNLGCPICSKRILSKGINDLATTNPGLAKKWHPHKNGKLTPSDVTVGSHTKAWFICESGHEYEQQIKSSLLYGCNRCSGNVVVPGETDLLTLRPDIAAEWHPKLNDRGPSEVMLGSDYQAWWIDEKNHEWKQVVQVRSRGVGCPKCAQLGYDQTSPGMLYFIRHEGFGARKIGITNLKSKFDRIKGFTELGWATIATFEDEDGSNILGAETKLFRWLRKELALPAYLGKAEMGRLGGNSETFSGEGVSDSEVIKKIESTLADLRK